MCSTGKSLLLMKTRTQDGLGSGRLFRGSFGSRGSESRPLSLRLLAILCLLLVAVMSTVQVCHVHDAGAAVKQGTQRGSHGSSDPATEDHCPLCVAMHSARPADIQVAPEPVIAVRALESVAADAERMFRWRFEMASRPPPPAGTFA